MTPRTQKSTRAKIPLGPNNDQRVLIQEKCDLIQHLAVQDAAMDALKVHMFVTFILNSSPLLSPALQKLIPTNVDTKTMVQNSLFSMDTAMKVVFPSGGAIIAQVRAHQENMRKREALVLKDCSQLNTDAIDLHIKKLSRVVEKLEKNIAKNDLYGNIGFILIVIHCFSEYFLSTRITWSNYLNLIISSFAWITFKTSHFRYESKRDRAKINELNNAIALEEMIASAIPAQFLKEISSTKERIISSRTICIQLKPFEDFSADLKTQIIKNILLRHGCRILHIEKNKIMTGVDFKLDTHSAKLIHDSIMTEITDAKNLKAFKKQITRISELINVSLHHLPTKDESGKSGYQFYLDIPESLPQDKMMTIFSSAYKQVNLFANNHQLIISDNHPATQKDYELLVLALKNLQWSPDIKRTPSFFTNNENSPVQSKFPQIKQKREKQKPVTSVEKLKLLVAAEKKIEEVLRIQWQQAVYDSSAITDESPQPITSHTLPKNTFFIISELEKSDLGHDAEAWKKFQEILKAPKLAPTRNGTQGIIFDHNHQQQSFQDKHGQPFVPAVKLKILGTYGRVRLFAAAERAPTGEMLYVVKAYKNKH